MTGALGLDTVPLAEELGSVFSNCRTTWRLRTVDRLRTSKGISNEARLEDGDVSHIAFLAVLYVPILEM